MSPPNRDATERIAEQRIGHGHRDFDGADAALDERVGDPHRDVRGVGPDDRHEPAGLQGVENKGFSTASHDEGSRCDAGPGRGLDDPAEGTRGAPALRLTTRRFDMNRFDWTFSGSAEVVIGAVLVLVIVAAAFA